MANPFQQENKEIIVTKFVCQNSKDEGLFDSFFGILLK
jgi:hypothetical protein